MTGTAHIVHRDGKDYVKITNLSAKNKVSKFKASLNYENTIAATIFKLVESVITSSWRIIKPLMDPTINRFIGEVLEEVVTPMFNEIPLQEFFNF